MAELNINDLEEYNFKNAQKGDTVIVAKLLYGDLHSIDICRVKGVSPKRGDVTLDNGLKFSKIGYEYGYPFVSTNHYVFAYSEESKKLVEGYIAHRKIAQKIMGQIREISVKLMMKSTADNCRKLSLALEEILEAGDC